MQFRSILNPLFFYLGIFQRALKRMRPWLLSLLMRTYALHHSVKNGGFILEGSTYAMISSTLKPHTNAHTVCGRPTLNVFERFLLKGRSADITRDQFASEHF